MFRFPARLRTSARTAAIASALITATTTAAAQSSLTTRVSLDSANMEQVGASNDSRISKDGRYVVFSSFAALVPADTNGLRDVYRYDRTTSTVMAISVSGAGVFGNGASSNPSISNDGQVIAFESAATNFQGIDTNGVNDIYVRNVAAGSTGLVSADFSPLPAGPAIVGNGASRLPDISGDTFFNGAFNSYAIAYETDATNLLGVGGDVNGVTDIYASTATANGWASPIFVFLPTQGLVSQSSSGAAGNLPSGGLGQPACAVSDDARWVVYSSLANNLDQNDTNGAQDIFLFGPNGFATTRVSVDSSGAQASGSSTYPAINNDGTRIVFQSDAANLVSGGNGTMDVYMRDVPSGQTFQASVATDGTPGNGASLRPDISGDGQFIAYDSVATNLVPGDTNGKGDVFVYSVYGMTTLRASVSSGGTQGNEASYDACLSGAGSLVSFSSDAVTLIAGDNNGSTDVFVRGCGCGTNPGYCIAQVYCTPQVNSAGCTPSISFNGSPSNSVSTGFVTLTRNLMPNSVAIQIYGVSGPLLPMNGGLCVNPTVTRVLPPSNTGGAAACSGIYSLDFNGVITGDPGLTLGTTVWTQTWSRDTGAASGANFSDAVEFLICD